MDSEIALALTRLGELTDRLLATAGALDDAGPPRRPACPAGPAGTSWLTSPATLTVSGTCSSGPHRDGDADVPG